MTRYFIGLIIVAGLFILTNESLAQGETFLFNWKSEALVPGFYQGKILPTKNSAVIAGFEITRNNKLINLKPYEIRWFVNNKLAGSGFGQQKVKFTQSNIAGEDLMVRIEIIGFNNGNSLEKTFVIPVVVPEVIVDAPIINRGENTLRAWPFFFNVDDFSQLQFGWRLNGEEASEMPPGVNSLSLNVSVFSLGGPTTIEAMVRSLGGLVELAKKTVNLTID